MFLPYRDPETLNLFLKEIDCFSYDHRERLGNPFEYLLSVLGTQGYAGQFRTPRHIIDFIVAVVDPKKTETILDPACGTAGFLISAFKHILRAHNPSDPPDRSDRTLTPDERCDVILANPPFMTSKGGIRPHNRFAIKSKLAEVWGESAVDDDASDPSDSSDSREASP